MDIKKKTKQNKTKQNRRKVCDLSKQHQSFSIDRSGRSGYFDPLSLT
jgi:hypothetical protein